MSSFAITFISTKTPTFILYSLYADFKQILFIKIYLTIPITYFSRTYKSNIAKKFKEICLNFPPLSVIKEIKKAKEESNIF